MGRKKSQKKMYGVAGLESRLGRLTVGTFLRSWRKAKKQSQKSFAKMLRMSPANLCDIERGRKGLSLEKVAEIANTLGYPTSVLVRIALEDQVKAAGLRFTVEVNPTA